MSAPSYVNAANMSKGPRNAEASINLNSVTHNCINPKHFYSDRYGGRIGFAYDYDISYEATVEGEVNTAAPTSALAATHGASVTFANELANGGWQDMATGDMFLGDNVTFNEPQGEYGNVSIPLIGINGLSVA